MKVTLKDVAKKAGMSVTTVSRALNDFDDVAEETKAYIRATASELGYAPNLNARRLKTERADAIGLILPGDNLRFSDPFFSELLSGIIDQIAQYGLELNVTTPTASQSSEELYLKYIRSRRVDGFILVRTEQNDPRIALLQEHEFPFIAFGRTESSPDYPFVDEDGTHGIRLAIDHLVSLGHTRIACIGEPKVLTKSHQRVLGFISGLNANGIKVDPELIVEGNFRQRSGRASARKLLDLPNPPTAIVAVNDLLAIGAISAIQERGLTVGKDISVTGFDDIQLAEFVSPSLTTLHQPAHEMGTLLCQSLVRVINGNAESPPQTVLQPQLVVRNSTGLCPA